MFLVEADASHRSTIASVLGALPVDPRGSPRLVAASSDQCLRTAEQRSHERMTVYIFVDLDHEAKVFEINSVTESNGDLLERI